MGSIENAETGERLKTLVIPVTKADLLGVNEKRRIIYDAAYFGEKMGRDPERSL
jgi:hypothetical protein